MALCHHNQLETKCSVCNILGRVVILEQQVKQLLLVEKLTATNDFSKKEWDGLLRPEEEVAREIGHAIWYDGAKHPNLRGGDNSPAMLLYTDHCKVRAAGRIDGLREAIDVAKNYVKLGGILSAIEALIEKGPTLCD